MACRLLFTDNKPLHYKNICLTFWGHFRVTPASFLYINELYTLVLTGVDPETRLVFETQKRSDCPAG